MDLDRRTLLALTVGAVLSAPPEFLLAKNNGSNNNGVGNDNSNDHDNGVGNDDADSNDQGGGNDDSGGNDNGVDSDEGGGNDNDSGNDDGVDSDVGGNNSVDSDDQGDEGGKVDSGRSKKREEIEWSQDKVLKERELGHVISLTTALRIVNAKVHGRVIDVDLMVRRGRPQYRVKVRRKDGLIRTVRLDARTGKMISLLGL